MTTSNCFEYAKNPHVNEIVTKKIPKSKLSIPKNLSIIPVTGNPDYPLPRADKVT